MTVLHRASICVIVVLLQACGNAEHAAQKTALIEVAPSEVLPGDTITITGKRLGRKPHEVFVGAVTAEVTSWSSTEITAIVPQVDAATYPVYIRIGDWQSNELTLVVGEKSKDIPPDITAPETSISNAPAALTNATSAEFSFIGQDNIRVERFECRRDNGAWGTCASPFRYQALGEGSHRFEVKAIDKAGNEDTTPATAEWQIDVTPPDSSISDGPATTTSSILAAIIFSASETADTPHFACRLDSGTWQSCSSPMVLTDLAEGAHEIAVQAIDAVGNADPSPSVWAWFVDLTPPETSTVAGPAPVTNSSTAVITFSASDASLFTFECSLDSAIWQACTSPQIYNGLTQGNHNFAVRAVDAAGHSDATPATWDWLIDQTPPNTTLTAGPETVTKATTAVISFDGTDNVAVAGYECRLDAGAWASCSSPKTYSSLAAGIHDFYVQAIDTGGNVEPSPATASWTVDLTPPNTSLTSTPSSVTSATTAEFSFNGTDNLAVARYECRLDASEWGACTSPMSYVSLGAGTHTFDVRAIDSAGQPDASPATHGWTIDLAPPDTTITSGPLAVTESTAATFVFSGTDNLGVARYECRLDSGAWLTCTSPKAYPSLATGSHTFEARAIDTAGHPDPTPAAWPWAIDGEPRIDERYPHVATLGTAVSLGGKYFGAVSGSVTIGGAPALIQGWSDTVIQVSVGNGTPKGAQPIIVTTDQGQMSNSMPISIRGSDVWLADDIPEARSHATAVWTGKEMIVWGGHLYGDVYFQTGGRYNPITDTWVSTSLAGAPVGRRYHSAVWTGSEMIAWGGTNGTYLGSGARYNPNTDSWTTLPSAGAPTARRSHTAVWTGTQMLVWGGYDGSVYLNTGARYDVGTNSWLGLSTTGAPTGRESHAAVWAGDKMLIWGGLNGSNTGGRYDPATDTWAGMSTTGAPTARQNPSAIWTGTQMVVWGGYAGATYYNTGGRYDPQSDTWQSTTTTGAPTIRSAHTTVWTGTRMLVWGGFDGSVNLNTGGRYDPVADSWQSIATAGAPAARWWHAATWTGTHMLVWGGAGNVYFDTGGRYDPTANSWTGIAGAGAPPGSRYHGAVWTGSQMIVWGGFDNPAYLNTGGRYNPTTDTWLSTTTSGAPSARAYHTAIWTGSRMVVWGGYYSNGFGYWLQTGAQYDPATDSWNSTTVTGAPVGRQYHTALWTGTQMLVWGGYNGSMSLGGGRYDPTSNSWLAMSTAGEPQGRYMHTAVWTGTEMIVWGATSNQTGGRYDPNTDTWMSTAVTGAPAARYAHSAVWTGTEMVVWGGYYNSTYFNTGGKYDPATDTWTTTSTVGAPSARRDHSAIWTGSEMVIWGGVVTPTGGRYEPTSDTWRSTTMLGAATRRDTHSALWTGNEMLIWGGYCGGTELNSVGRYIP